MREKRTESEEHDVVSLASSRHITPTHTYYTHILHTLTDEVPLGGQLHIAINWVRYL